MEISSFLSPGDVLVDVPILDKARLLQELSRRAAARLGIDERRVAAEVLKREDLGSTGVGKGVALPHARLGMVHEPFGILARLRRPIDFHAIDEKPVDIVFLLLLPAEQEGKQLNALACVARKLREEASLQGLRAACSEAELYRAVAGNPAVAQERQALA